MSSAKSARKVVRLSEVFKNIETYIDVLSINTPLLVTNPQEFEL